MPEPYAGSTGYMSGTTLNTFLNAALSAVGQPYRWGGAKLNWGVDCSGLVHAALLHAGYRPPRTANMIQKWAALLNPKDARAGDLVFWNKAGSTDRVPGADHTGIYLGGGMVLEASSSQGKVVIRKLWGNYEFRRVTPKPSTPIQQKLGSSGITLQSLARLGKIPAAPPPGPEGERSTDPEYAASQAMGGGGQPPVLPAHATEQQIVDFIIENYGLTSRAFLQIPELRKALIEAAKAGAVGDRGLEYVYKTKWWKSRTEAQRSWDVLVKADPKEAQDRILKRMALLTPLWEQFGIDDNINRVAQEFERLGMNEAQLNIRLANSLQAESVRTGLDKGTTGANTADDLMRIARMEYLTPVDRQQAERWAIKAIRTGTDVEDGWRAYLSSVSSQRFGIDPTSGIAPADALAPIKSSIAENLEINPETIDLLDPKYADVLQVKTEDGKYRPMTSAEATRWARSQEEFKGTATAERASTDLAEALGKAFGKVG